MKNFFHYLFSGLENIYLCNGYVKYNAPEEGISIEDLNGLHKTITSILVHEKRRLKPKEFWFLRKEMRYSQDELGRMLGVTEQTIARVEKGQKEAKIAFEAIVRELASENVLKEHMCITHILSEINDESNQKAKNHKIFLEYKDNFWKHISET